MSSTSPPATQHIECDCCVAGGGPAGVMLGFLLARAGIRVVILEKHADFLRDFRGDTIHPSTLQIMHELGLLDAFLARPHQEMKRIAGVIGGQHINIADFSHLPVVCKFVALMPQWDFLDFLAGHGAQYPGFDLRREAEVIRLLCVGDRVTGVIAKTRSGELHVHAQLVVGADGRTSTLRAQSGLHVTDLGAPIDVLWMRLPKHDTDPAQTLGYVDNGRMLVMLDRGDYWQCAYVIRKGGFVELQKRGLEAFQHDLTTLAPFLANRAGTLTWSDIKLLTVAVDRLDRWYTDGLLFIGDAAHAMSPIGGVGINLAVQDAVAAANILAEPLRHHGVTPRLLENVQKRREMPTRWTQALQVTIQNRLITAVLSAGPGQPLEAPLVFRAFNVMPWLQRLPARVIGLGFRPEHVRTPVA